MEQNLKTLLGEAIEPYDRGIGINSSDPKHNVEAVKIDHVYQKVCQQMNP